MNRREFVSAGLAAGVAGSTGFAVSGGSGKSHLYELRTYELRNDQNPSRIQNFFRSHFLPALKKQGLAPVGCFSVVAGQQTPSFIVLIDYDSPQQLRSVTEQIASDKSLAEAWKSFEAGNPAPYVRYESALFRAFSGHPEIEPPSSKTGGGRHLFELRTYESRHAFDLAAKIDMFNQEEIEIFRKCGIHPVFFGEAVFGARLPQLTYLAAYDDMAAREKAWEIFRTHPDWIRIKDKPEWKDTVTSIHASFLAPTDFSDIR